MQLNTVAPKKVVIRDSTLREGLDMPGMDRRLKDNDRFSIAAEIYRLGIREFDIIHPGRVNRRSRRLAEKLKQRYGKNIVVHGAAYAFNPRLRQELDLMTDVVDEIDLVMPLVRKREPFSRSEKTSSLLNALAFFPAKGVRKNAGFANSSQADARFLLQISRKAAAAGAEKIILYDSIGSLDPLETYNMVRRVRAAAGVPVLYHCHNDLGLAAANSLFAVYAGAEYVDATVNGLGDRAGNAPMEQLAAIFNLKKIATGLDLGRLRKVSDMVEKLSGVARSPISPVVGNPRFIFSHISPKHRNCRGAFEVLPPVLLK